ncbi:zinc-ribbon domain-containing protein [Clostridium baratii]
MNESRFVYLGIFWDIDKNGGTLEEISPSYEGKEYWWKCLRCGTIYLSTLKKVLLGFKRNRFVQIDNRCDNCRMLFGYDVRGYYDFLDYVDDGKKDTFKALADEFLSVGNCAYRFYNYCPDCGKLNYCTQDTIRARNGLYCKDCASVRKAVITHGSIASELPEVVPYYSDKNRVSADRVPLWKVTSSSNNFIVNCPSCGSEITKRLDAIINNGAYCGPCAKHKNAHKNGNSLYEKYPEVAKMFDRGNSDISSKNISYGSNKVYKFLCENGDIPHIINRKVCDMVAAYRRGNLGCPVCQGFEVQKGVNDFETRFPEMEKYWDYDKNTEKPSEVYYKSHEKYYFLCSEGHSFKRDISHMRRSVNTKTKGCPVCHGKEVVEGVNDLYFLRPDLMNDWDYDINTIKPWQVTVSSNKVINVHCKNSNCNNIFSTSVYNWVNSLVVCCEDCRKRQWSVSEKELVEEIKSWGIKVIEESKFLGGNISFDIYIPSRGIAIEYNGLYWHSDNVRDNHNYHYEKYLACKEVGVQLLYVWEDDYKTKKDLVLRILKNKLGLLEGKKVNARDCIIGTLDYSDAKRFLDENHIQGSVTGSEYLCLMDKNKVVVSVMVLEEDGDMINLKRYATNCNVRGGFSKLLKYTTDTYNYKGIYTFSDNSISDGSLYSNNGFTVDKLIKPDYSYVVGGVRKHKFNYRIDRFRRDSELLYRDGLSERELACLNGLLRVWDAGKVRWVKYFD